MSRVSLLTSLVRGLVSGAGARTAAAVCSTSSIAPVAVELLTVSALKASHAQGLLLARHFTSSGAQLNLASVLKEELAYEKQQKPEQIAQGPPAPFKLSEAPGDTLLTLTRSGKDGEEIAVDLHVNAQPSAPFEGEGDDDSDETLNFVAFNVSVTKGDTSLVFECESDGTCVNINHVSLEPKDGIEQESVYTGPVFSELDEGLQKQFATYLEERGITPEMGEYLRFLVHDKEQREYMTWLEKVHKLVS